MIDKCSCKEAFVEKLMELAEKDRNIVAITSDARGSSSLTPFTEVYPRQFVEVGIAEQNEIGIAAGLACVGKKPYVFAPASFMCARSLEQIKVDMAYSQTNVKILAVSGGISYGALGASHHSLHDIAVMRAIPGLTVILPCDENQTKAVLGALYQMDGPAYIRVGKVALPSIYEKDTALTIGKANQLAEGKDLTIIACGEMVSVALEAAKHLSARVLDMHTLKPLDEDAVIKAAKETGRIITIEEHHISGGLGAAVAQITAGHCPIPVEVMALPDENVVSGKPAEVFAHYGLTAEGIIKRAKERGRI